MAGIASGPPVLETETYFIHPTYPKCEKRSLTARIQFFSGNIVHRMNDAQFIMLPQATSVASMTRTEVNRVRSFEMLEDHLKKKLGREYSTYLDCANAESASEAESLSEPESDGGSRSKPREPIKQVSKTNVRDLESLKLIARPQPRATMRRVNKFTETELRQLGKYVTLHPPVENRSGRPTGEWWVKLYEDCEWARTHTHYSWRTWGCRYWDEWMAARKKASSKASSSIHSIKASTNRPKRVETIVLSSSESSSESEGEEQSPPDIPQVNAVEDPRDSLEAPTSNAEDDRPTPQGPHDTASLVQRSGRTTDTETESSEEDDASQPANAPKQANPPLTVIVRPLSPSSPPPVNPPRSHLGFACWRRRPRVFVADSDPSQTTATTTTTQSTNPRTTQFTQLTSASAIPAAQKSRILTQSSASTSQKPQSQQTQSQRDSQAAFTSGSGSGTSGRNPWIAPDAEAEDSDGDYNATRHAFDADSDDDGWSENSSENGTDDEEPESFHLTGTAVDSGIPAVTRKRRWSVLVENDQGTGFRKLVDLHLPGYFERAVREYSETQPQTQTTTQQSQSQSATKAAGASQSWFTLSSQQQQKRRRLVNAVLSLISHWMQISLPKVRNVWKSLPREKRTFEELQKKCLQCDLSTSRKEYDATGLFTQQSPRSRVRKRGDDGGPARKRRRLDTFPPSLGRDGSSNTEADFDEFGDENEESDIYFGGQDPDAPPGGHDDNDGANQEPPPILFRQTRLMPGSSKILHPYPAQPDKEWAKRICRVLAARYEWRRASKVHQIWEEVGGDAKRVENALKEGEKTVKDKSVGDKTLLDLGLGDIPRPWA